MAEAIINDSALISSSPPELVGGAAFIDVERRVLGHLIRHPERTRRFKRWGLNARCYVAPLNRRIYQRLVHLVVTKGDSARVHPHRFMKDDPVFQKLGKPHTLMEMAQKAASDDNVQSFVNILVRKCDDRRHHISSTNAMIQRDNPLEAPLHIKRLARLDAHSLTEVIETVLGADTLSDRLGRHVQPLE